EAVFRPVLKAIDVPSDAAFEVPLNFGDGQTEQLRVLKGILEQFFDGFGGKSVGAKTVGEDATEGAAPMPAISVASGVQDGLPEKEIPILQRQYRSPRTARCAHHAGKKAAFAGPDYGIRDYG